MQVFLLSEFLAEVFEEFCRWFFYVVDQAYVLGRYDVAESNGVLFFVDDAGHEAVRFAEQSVCSCFAGRIMIRCYVFHLDQVFIVPLNGVQVVECNAWCEDVDIGETFMVDSSFDDVDHGLAVDSISLCYEGSAGSQCHSRSIERSQRVAVRGCLGDEALIGSRRRLALCQAVYLVIEYEVGDVHISLDRMHSMAQADGVGVAVAGADDHVLILVSTFDALCERKSSAMRRVGAIAVLIAADTGGAADAGNQCYILMCPSHLGAYS